MTTVSFIPVGCSVAIKPDIKDDRTSWVLTGWCQRHGSYGCLAVASGKEDWARVGGKRTKWKRYCERGCHGRPMISPLSPWCGGPSVGLEGTLLEQEFHWACLSVVTQDALLTTVYLNCHISPCYRSTRLTGTCATWKGMCRVKWGKYESLKLNPGNVVAVKKTNCLTITIKNAFSCIFLNLV